MKDVLEALRDVDYRVRREAVLSLKDKPGAESTSVLIEALGDDNESVSSEAVKILESFGEQALPHLIGALKHSSWSVRRNAAQVLAGVGSEYLETLLDMARSNDDDIQFWISEVISQFGSRSVGTLVTLIEGEDLPSKLCAIAALGRTGVNEAVRPLLNCLDDSQWTIRKAAASALIQLGQVAVDDVVRVLNCGHHDREFWAIQILCEVGGSKACKAVISKLMDEHLPVDQKQSIIQGMRSMETPEIIDPLIQMLGDQNWFVRKQAAETLWELGDSCVDKLARALKSQNTDIRFWSVKVLGDLQAKEMLPQVTHMLKNDSSWSVRASAAQALGEIGEEDSTLDLVDSLRDSSEYVKKNSMVALSRIGEIKQQKEKISEEWVQDFTRKVFTDLQSKRTRTAITRIRELVRDVPDFPKPGVMFKDITPVLTAPNGLSDVIRLFQGLIKERRIDLVAGVDSRGFILGAALAQALRVGFVPVRKAGKLPGKVLSESYSLEYGEATLEIQEDSVGDQSVLIIDDILATGGTAAAASSLIQRGGGHVAGLMFLIELEFLQGRERLSDYTIQSLIQY